MTQPINWYSHKKTQRPSMSPKATFPQQNSTDVNEISAIARTRTSLTDPNSKASQTSNRKWQNQARQFILNWTPQQIELITM
jgi:hypothetical protein